MTWARRPSFGVRMSGSRPVISKGSSSKSTPTSSGPTWTQAKATPSHACVTVVGEFERALKRRSSSGLKTELEEVIGVGDRVVVVTRMPGLDGVRARQAVDRNFDVVTVRSERLVSIRACHDLAEAMAMLGSSLEQ